MAGAAGIRAGRAYVEFGVDNNPLSAGLRSAQARLKQFGSSMTAVGSGLMGMSAAAATPLVLATTQFASFESGMARVQALTNASEKDFAALSEEAKRLGRDTVYTATEAAKAMGVFALAGYQTADILKATGPALNLAAAGQMDLAQAADISMKVMSGMGIATENLGGAIDVLAKAMTTANTDLIMLGEAFKYVGPVARSAGMSLEEITAAIQILSDAGIQSDMAGTTLRGAILSLTSPSEEAKKALKQMGVQVIDAQGNFRGLTAIIADMEKALSGLGSGTRLQLIGDVFANRQATGIATLIDRGAAEMKKKTDALGTAAKEGVTARIAGIQLNTLYGGFMLLISAAEGLALVIGEALNPTLRGWGQAAIDAITITRKIVDANKEWVPVIASTILGVGAVGAGLVAMGLAAQVVAVSVGGIATAWAAVVGIAGALFSPMGLIAGGIVYFATMTDAGQKMTSAIGDGLKGLSETVTTAWGGIVDAVQAGDLAQAGQVAWVGLKTVWQQGITGLYSAWSDFSGFFVDTWYKAVNLVAKGMNDAFAGMSKAWVETTSWFDRDQEYWEKQSRIMGVTAKRIRGEITREQELEQIGAIENEASPAEKRRKDQLAQIDKDRLGMEGILDADAKAERARRDLARKEAQGAMNADLEKAKKELADAVARADMLKNAAVSKPAGADLAAVTPKKLRGEADRVMPGGSAAGTFNSAAIRSLVGGSQDVPRMQLEEAKRQNENLKKILGEVRDNNIAFA